MLLPLLDASYNRPKLSPCASWNPNGITFADNNTMIRTAAGLFVNKNNTVYATSYGLNTVLVWPQGSTIPTTTIFSDLSDTHSIFVTINGDVYVDDGNVNHRMQKWAANASNSTTVMQVNGRCGGLFIDAYDNLYWSLPESNLVATKSIESDANSSVIVAGNGTAGSTSDALHLPFGIFVDIHLSLYVAEYGNDRIQFFQYGQRNGTTVAGNGTSNTIALDHPTDVVLDADGYLFIADQWHHRIVGSGPNGFRCIAGCTGTSGSAADQLLDPFALGFDSYGNLYVTDALNNRIQKFILARNKCGE